MERSEGQLKSIELTNDEITLINKIMGEFLQADHEQLVSWVLELLNEKGKEIILSKINNSKEWYLRIAFVGYLYQKSKEDREKILEVSKKLPEDSGFIGLGGHHAIFDGITPFVNMIAAERITEGGLKYFKNLPEDF